MDCYYSAPPCDWLAWRLALIQQSVIDSEAVEGEMYWGVERQTGRRLCWGCVSRIGELFLLISEVASGNLKPHFWLIDHHWLSSTGTVITGADIVCKILIFSDVCCVKWLAGLSRGSANPSNSKKTELHKMKTIFIVRCNWMKTGICVKPPRCPNKASPPLCEN